MKMDHVELFVPSREQAAAWYGSVFGFEIMEQHRYWAELPGGPLMITNDGGDTKIALFQGPSQESEEVRGLRRLAFRVDAAAFLDFFNVSGAWRSTPLTRQDIQDHDQALSVYFTDPYGNLLEVTTYEPEAVRERLPA